jgi:hypothetical protein
MALELFRALQGVGGAVLFATATPLLRAEFFVNLPIGVAAFAGGVARLRESRNPAGGRADWAGTALITVALTALMFALIRGNAMGWARPSGADYRPCSPAYARSPTRCRLATITWK